MINNRKRAVLLSLALILGVMGLASCSSITDQWASSDYDHHVCVYDGSERGGKKLKDQVPPGEEAVRVDDNDVIVEIPASNRFYMASDDGTKDPGAPEYYPASAKDSVPVKVMGQLRFKFNLAKACDWYSKHGRRNATEDGDLGFNVRGDASQGWFVFLNENFGITMKEVVRPATNSYGWEALEYNYPVNANELGEVKEGTDPGEPTWLAYGRDVGSAFQTRLNAQLGDKYFCGIPNGSEKTEKDKECPPIEFQVTRISPVNGELVAEREKLENTRQKVEQQNLEGKLLEDQAAQIAATEKAKQAQLEAKLRTAELEAQIANAACLQLAEKGLDCEGHHPNVIVPGVGG